MDKLMIFVGTMLMMFFVSLGGAPAGASLAGQIVLAQSVDDCTNNFTICQESCSRSKTFCKTSCQNQYDSCKARGSSEAWRSSLKKDCDSACDGHENTCQIGCRNDHRRCLEK